jgi:hypothetical protein
MPSHVGLQQAAGAFEPHYREISFLPLLPFKFLSPPSHFAMLKVAIASKDLPITGEFTCISQS